MERISIFLLKVSHNESIEIPNNHVSVIRLQQLLLKHRGNDNHEVVPYLKKLRLKQGLTIADITRLTGINYDSYIKYEKGFVKPEYMNLNTLEKLSNLFGENLLTDYHIFKKNSKQIIARYKNEHKLSVSQFSKMMGVSTHTIKNWLNGTCAPSYDKWDLYFKNI